MILIRALIVDDEPPARARLKRMVEALPGCEVCGEAGSGAAALTMISSTQPDLVLLDISMPGMDGMGLAAALQKMDKAPEIVFCTAWPDRALEAFDRDAVDYLVKPVREDRLKVAIDKVARVLGRADAAADQEFLRSTVGGKTMLIDLGDVICLVAEDKYTTVWYEGGKTVINDSLVELERRFPDRMLRIHRKTLVAPGRIRGLERTGSGKCLLVLDGTDEQPEISRRQLSMVRNLLRELG